MDDNLHLCLICRVSKDKSEFYLKDKRGRLDCYCKPCRAAYFKAYHSRHRKHYSEMATANKKLAKAALRPWVDSMKDAPCADCGGRFPAIVMDFDHKDNAKDRTIAKMVQACLSRERILAEIRKCDLVCSNCHRVRTLKSGHYTNIGKRIGPLAHWVRAATS